MKRRDIAKYVFAATIALTSVVAITGMTLAKRERRARSAEEVRRIREALERNGVRGQLPDRINTSPIAHSAQESAASADSPPKDLNRTSGGAQ